MTLKLNLKNSSRIIGIMSGTSHDGADLVLLEIKTAKRMGKKNIKKLSNFNVTLITHLHCPYSKSFKEKIRKAFIKDTELICGLNIELGEFYAKGTLKLLKDSGFKPEDIDAIASHGQTIYHIPPSGRKSGSTLQIGEASVIAERTGIMTISDFRTRDMAAGGEGAPLVSISDYLLFHKKGDVRAVVNIGGIANVTLVKESKDNVLAFDIGPGNSLIDEAMRIYSKGRKFFDRNGLFAKSGKPDKKLYKGLSYHPFLKKKPPKSTGREVFGTEMVETIFNKYHNLKPENIVSTLTHFTAKIIYDAVILYKPNEVIVTGGGTKNKYLMKLIHDRFNEHNIPVNNISHYGIPPEAKEAVSFAILSYLTLNRIPGNIPSATGARHEVILGKISLP